MVTPDEPVPPLVVPLSGETAATKSGVPTPRDPCVRPPEDADATVVVVEKEGAEEGGGSKVGSGTAATATTTVKAAGIDPSEHRREGQNGLGNDLGNGVGSDSGNCVGKSSPAVGTSGILPPARRLSGSSVRLATGYDGIS